MRSNNNNSSQDSISYFPREKESQLRGLCLSGPCTPNPCHNGGTCEISEAYRGDTFIGYVCKCSRGFNGIHCQHSKSSTVLVLLLSLITKYAGLYHPCLEQNDRIFEPASLPLDTPYPQPRTYVCVSILPRVWEASNLPSTLFTVVRPYLQNAAFILISYLCLSFTCVLKLHSSSFPDIFLFGFRDDT